ncbi:MAG: hypothetical protein HY819_03680 [Acidobacteria bacterium]|nr:hypothetical protein [Acidobacteriota bacterium]
MSSKLRPMSSHNNLHSLLFQATSAEYIALCVQCYQLARHSLLLRLESGTFNKPAIVLDLDETVLDNSAYQAWQISAGTNFDEKSSWREWSNLGIAGAVPGALEFVSFAQSQGVVPIFITSRENLTRKGTAKNLFGLKLLSEKEYECEADYKEDPRHAFRTRLFMKGMPAVEVENPQGKRKIDLINKFRQRVFCEQVLGYEIILSIGDNLSDYAEYYGRVLENNGTARSGMHPTFESRKDAVLQDLRLFGRDFILIPNVTYGGWLRAFEGNGLGAGDELAATGSMVREPLQEPQEPFQYADDKVATPKGAKFSEKNLGIWEGPATQSDSVHSQAVAKKENKPE